MRSTGPARSLLFLAFTSLLAAPALVVATAGAAAPAGTVAPPEGPSGPAGAASGIPQIAAGDPAQPFLDLQVETTLDKASCSWFGTLTVIACVTSGSQPAPGCDSVVVTSPANPRVRSYLADDGVPPDPVAGDGAYTGRFEVGAGVGEARPPGTYTVSAAAYAGADSASDASPPFSLYTVRRWTGITTSSVPDPYDAYTTFFVTSNGPGAGWHHAIHDFGLVRSSAVSDAQIRLPVLPADNTITGLMVTGPGVSDVEAAGNVIAFTCDLTGASVTRVDLEFDSPSDLAATFIDRYYTGDIGQRNFRNGYLVWNRYIHTGIMGSDFSAPHGPGCVVDLHVTDLGNGEAHTVDCMERVAVHLDDTPYNDGTGTYPSNVKWGGDALGWLRSAGLQSILFSFPSGGAYGLADKVSVTKTVEFYSESRSFRHSYVVRNIDSASHDFDFVWGREQWLYGSAAGSNRQMSDRGLLPNDPAAYGGEHGFAPEEVDGNWFAAYDETSDYSIGVLLPEGTPESMPTAAYFLCQAPLGNYTGEYPIVPAGACTDMSNLFFEKQFGILAPGDSASYEFYQWGGYGSDREDLTHLIWRDAVRLSGEPLAMDYAPLGDEILLEASIEIWFNNPMDRPSTEAALGFTPEIPGGGSITWLESDRHLRFEPAAGLTAGTVYQVEVQRSALDGEGHPLATTALWYFETVSGTSDLAAAGASVPQPLLAAAPNPFARSTELRFSLAQGERASLAVYDVRGQLVDVLADERLPAGTHIVSWQGNDRHGRPLGNGLYFCRLRTADRQEVRKVVIRR